MTTTEQARDVGLRFALIPVLGYGIAASTVARMLDPRGEQTGARLLGPTESVPAGARPVLLADTTAYGLVSVERLLRRWNGAWGRPWLVLVADVPAPPPAGARYRMRALGARLEGVVQLPYLPSLRLAEGPDEAMEYDDVQRAAKTLRRALEGN